MLDILSVFKRNTNQLFGICVDLLNVGRSLQQLSLSMQTLALDGVVQPAKVGEGKGRPILALVEILNHTPGETRPEVEAIEHLCAKLAKLAAHSSNIVWRYYQLVSSLLMTIPREYRSSSRTTIDAIPDLRFTTPNDLALLMAHPSFQIGERLERNNRQFIAAICQANLAELHERLREALDCLDDTRRALHGLETIGLTARYMAFCIASEAAGLGAEGMNFKNLSTEIGQAVDELNAKTRSMKTSIDGGLAKLDSARSCVETRHDLPATWVRLSGRNGRQTARLARHAGSRPVERHGTGKRVPTSGVTPDCCVPHPLIRCIRQPPKGTSPGTLQRPSPQESPHPAHLTLTPP